MIKDSALKQIIELQKLIGSSGFTNTGIEEKLYNYEFTAVKNGTKNKIQVYFGKKGIRKVIQGNSTTSVYEELANIISGNMSLPFTKEKEQEYDDYIGTDETGKGDYFGPLVISGFYATKSNSIQLYDLGVKDSKELSDQQINLIAKKIIKLFPKHFSTILIYPEKYNQLYEKFQNVNKMLNWGHSKVTENILKIHNTKVVITDQFSKEPLQISRLATFSDIEFVQMTKAEKHLGVATASIIARYEMNKWFSRIQKEGIPVKKGASAEVEQAAKLITSKHGKEILPSLVKLHFKTTQKIFDN